tara:strand:+ start:74 stop:1042 length:969 start_codon:yes stop_codon:yes gene_type:complete
MKIKMKRNENMLWTEKYRPTRLNELRGQSNFVVDAEHWIESKEMPNLLLYGKAGTGKTTAALIVAKHILGDSLEGNFFEVNASDDRKLETIRTVVKEISSTRVLGDAPYKIILLDEMDGMTKDAQNALKRTMERYHENCRFIITCNDRYKIIHPLISRCANYRFKRLNNDEIRLTLDKVLQNEQEITSKFSDGLSSFSDEEMELFIEGLHGDLRRGITELQAAIASGKGLASQTRKLQEPYEEILQLVNKNNHENALKEVHKLIYQSVEMKEICVHLHDVIINCDLEYAQKFKLLRVVGEAEWRSNNMTPKVLASWMIGQMV